jgi:hypothetical protein
MAKIQSWNVTSGRAYRRPASAIAGIDGRPVSICPHPAQRLATGGHRQLAASDVPRVRHRTPARPRRGSCRTPCGDRRECIERPVPTREALAGSARDPARGSPRDQDRIRNWTKWVLKDVNMGPTPDTPSHARPQRSRGPQRDDWSAWTRIPRGDSPFLRAGRLPTCAEPDDTYSKVGHNRENATAVEFIMAVPRNTGFVGLDGALGGSRVRRRSPLGSAVSTVSLARRSRSGMLG